jgi:hypothetical protein
MGMVIVGLSVESFGVASTYLALALILTCTAVLALMSKSLLL